MNLKLLLSSVLTSMLYLSGWMAQAQVASISGKVVDITDQEALEFATISLYRQQDSTLLNGTLSDSAGVFTLKDLPKETYYLLVEFLGYESSTIESITFTTQGPVDLGTIGLNPTQRMLAEVKISGRKTTVMHRIDRQVFDAEQFRAAQGGTAADLLRNLPSVSIDAQGAISVRGARGFVLMLNGKQIQTDPNVLLNQLAANTIEDIEIITAPSAKYDPDGKAGIIHIKTRQGVLDGLYLLANVQWGLPSVEPYDNAEAARRYGADLTLNYKQGRWDLSFGVDYKRNDVSGRRVGYVNTYLNEVLTEFPSYGERSFDRENYTGRATVSYRPTNNQQLGVSLYAGKRTQFRTADILYDYQRRAFIPEGEFLGPEAYWNLYDRTGRVHRGGMPIDSLQYFNENLRVRRGDFLIGAIDYAFELEDKSSLNISVLYERTILGGPTDNINLAWPNVQDTLQLQFNDNDNPLDGVRFQLDYAKPAAYGTWELGYQFRYLKHPGDFVYLERDLERSVWEENPLFTNSINLQRHIHAAYGQLSGEWKKLSYTLGLRLEYADRSVGLASPDTTYLLELINPFPSVNLQYELGQGWVAKAAYSRRIERTTTFKMTPFPEREHSETLEQGDAELQPEFIDLLELGVVKSWGDNNLYATAYYRGIQDVINRVNTAFNDSILNRIYTNAGYARALGVEVGGSWYITQNWQVFAGANVYNYRIQGNLFGDEINTANTIYSINANTRVQLGWETEVQLALNYLSERVTAQGVDSRFYNPSLTLRKQFLNKRMALTFQWLNMDMGLLNSNEQRITTVRDAFFTTTNYIYEVDVLMLGLSFQLNQASKRVQLLKSEFGDKEF